MRKVWDRDEELMKLHTCTLHLQLCKYNLFILEISMNCLALCLVTPNETLSKCILFWKGCFQWRTHKNETSHNKVFGWLREKLWLCFEEFKCCVSYFWLGESFQLLLIFIFFAAWLFLWAISFYGNWMPWYSKRPIMTTVFIKTL